MTRYLVAGSSGMLGADLEEALAGRDVTLLSRSELDITDFDAAREAVAGHDVVINSAAYTRVDDAEAEEETAAEVNADGAENLAIAARQAGSVFVQLSTDYVFDGLATTPYAENHPLAPATAYGRTKARGEQLVTAANPGRSIVVRTAWLYGAHAPNFAATILELAAENDTVAVVNDQVGQPTWTLDLARQIVALLDTGTVSGTFHGTNAGQATWFDFARRVFELSGLDPQRIIATTSAEYPRPARRPPYSVLGHDAWASVGLSPMRPWHLALGDAFAAGAIG